MSLSNVKFVRKDGLNRLGAGSDYISGLLFYSNTLPAGFDTGDRVKKLFGVVDAENLGILDDHADETVASTGGTVTSTTAGSAGDVNSILINGASIGDYTVQSGDGNVEVAAGLALAINTLTKKSGFSATVSTDEVTIIPPAKVGVALNGAGISYASTGTGAATVVQLSGGVGSFNAAMHYHISEYFRMKPDGILYAGIYAVPATFDGTEIKSMQEATDGAMRQAGVYYPNATFATSQISSLQTQAELLRDKKQNIAVGLHSDMTGLALSNLADLSTLENSKVFVNIAEDGNWNQAAYSNTRKYIAGQKVVWLNKTYIANSDTQGNAPYLTSYWTEVSLCLNKILGYSVSTLGNNIGTIASAPVNESIGYPEKYDLSDNTVLDEAGFANGALYSAQTDNLLDILDDYHYVFTRKIQGLTGTFYNFGWTSIAQTSDYATIENNRTMDKAERLANTALAPKLNSPLFVNEDGTLSQSTIDLFDSIVDGALDALEIAQEISAKEVIIKEDQNVLQTSKLIITLKIVPVGVAKEIEVNNSYTIKIG